MFAALRRRMFWKLFLSYGLVILAGIVVLSASAELAIPTAFDRHMAAMMPMMGGDMSGMMGGMMSGSTTDMSADLFNSFRNAVNEALWRAGLAAFAAALAVSWFVSRRVVTPVRAMMQATRRIAEGHYEERVAVQGDPLEGDELTELAISFNRMAEKLAQVEAMRRQLLADVAHELRTPLTVIQGAMEGLLDGVYEPTPETFEEVHREAARLSRLVADLQELSRVEALAQQSASGQPALEKEPVALNDLVGEVARQLQAQFAAQNLRLHLNLPESSPVVSADRDRLAQVFINLLSNALRYTPPGGEVQVTCETTARHPRLPQGRWALVSVRDTGIGIAREDLPHIFDRFYRADKSRSRAGGGSGIGLTIAKHIVEAHGGRVWAESDGPGKGSTFTVALPL